MEKVDPELLNFIQKLVQKYYSNQNLKVILFGSRARGDNHERSDWDFAVKAKEEITEFFLDFKDEAPTLCGVDVIYYPTVSKDFKDVIDKEGILIYEQEKS